MSMVGVLVLWALVSTGLLAVIILNCPYALRIALARRLVWLCYPDGTLEPVPAKLEGVAYKTKKHGIFEFEKEDVFLFGKKPSIIVYTPYSRAIRPKVVAVLTKLKKLGIDRYDYLMAIINSVEVSPEELKEGGEQVAVSSS